MPPAACASASSPRRRPRRLVRRGDARRDGAPGRPGAGGRRAVRRGDLRPALGLALRVRRPGPARADRRPAALRRLRRDRRAQPRARRALRPHRAGGRLRPPLVRARPAARRATWRCCSTCPSAPSTASWPTPRRWSWRWTRPPGRGRWPSLTAALGEARAAGAGRGGAGGAGRAAGARARAAAGARPERRRPRRAGRLAGPDRDRDRRAALRDVLAGLDLDALAAELAPAVADGGDPARSVRRARLVADLRASGQRPEWAVLTALPVLPPTCARSSSGPTAA